jgi:hypothetical protein
MIGIISVATSGVSAIGQTDDSDNLYSDSTTPCVNAYYGIGEPINYAKAYKCFASNNIYEFMVVMQLNGQGVPASLAKAKAIMVEWKKQLGGPPGSADFDNMEQILAAHSKNGKPTSHPVDYCEDVAQTDYSVSYCTWIKDQLDKQNYDHTIQLIKQKLDPTESKLLDDITVALFSYLKAEGNRGEQQYAGGSAAGTAYSLQRIYARDHFTSLMRQWFLQMKPQPASKQDLAKAEAGMKAAYEASLDLYKENYPTSDNDQGDLDDFDETMREYVSEYEDDSKASQEQWDVLTKLCAQLAQEVYKSRKPNIDWSISMKTALANLRANEILYSPLGS